MILLTLALAPVIIILFYVYVRDKYEKEPIGLLLKAFFSGALIVIPILIVGYFIEPYEAFFNGLSAAAYRAFITAAFTEEFFKFAALYLLIWKSSEFDEKFDGIVYAVFISLGFAAVENVIYVYQYGAQTGIIRAVTAVPAHAIDGIVMGYFFGLARFSTNNRRGYLFKAFFYPFILHGIYDFILMSGYSWYLLVFVPFLIYLYITGLKKMKELSDNSRFKPWKFK